MDLIVKPLKLPRKIINTAKIPIKKIKILLIFGTGHQFKYDLKNIAHPSGIIVEGKD